MAVTLTEVKMRRALEAHPAMAERLHPVAVALVERYAPDAPEDVANEAVIRVAGWLYESPSSGVRSESVGDISTSWSPNMTSALRHSGAMALLSPWKVRRAGAVDGGGVVVVQVTRDTAGETGLQAGGGNMPDTMPSVRFGTFALDVSGGVTAATLPSLTAQQIFDLALPNEVQGLTQRAVSKAAPVFCHAQEFHFTRTDQYTFVAVFVRDGDMAPTHFRLKSTEAPTDWPQRFTTSSGQAVHSGELFDSYWWPVVFQTSEFPATTTFEWPVT